METRKALDGHAIGLMLVLCLVWGLQQVALKATAAEIAPIFQIALRSGVAAALVGLVMLARGERMHLAETWRAGLLVGLLFGLEFLLVGEGLRHTSASHMVVFLYTAPIFAALGLHWKLPAERLGAAQWLGIALAFGGLGRHDGGGALLAAGRGTGHANAVVPIARGLCAAAGRGLCHRPGALQTHAHGLGQPAVSLRRGVVRQLSAVVLAAAQVPGLAPGRVLVHDAAVWHGVGCVVAARTD